MNHKDLQTVLNALCKEGRVYGEDAPDHVIKAILLLQAELDKPDEPFGIWHQGATEEECEFFLFKESGDVSCPDCIRLYTRPQSHSNLEQENSVLRAGLAYYKQRAEQNEQTFTEDDEYRCGGKDCDGNCCQPAPKQEPTFTDAPPAPVHPVEVMPFSNAGLP